MDGWLAVFALGAAALVALTGWLLHRGRRIVEKEHRRHE